MALLGANELKRKTIIKVEGQPYTVVEVFFASPSARGASTMVKAKLKHLLTGAVLDKTFHTSEKFEEPDVVHTPATYLYFDGDLYHFMDGTTYEQFALTVDQLGDDRFFLKEGLLLQVRRYEEDPIAVQLPPFAELAVTHVEPGVRGDTGSGGATKPAKLETGLQVRVPLFIKEGEIVRVSTQTGKFAGRA